MMRFTASFSSDSTSSFLMNLSLRSILPPPAEANDKAFCICVVYWLLVEGPFGQKYTMSHDERIIT